MYHPLGYSSSTSVSSYWILLCPNASHNSENNGTGSQPCSCRRFLFLFASLCPLCFSLFSHSDHLNILRAEGAGEELEQKLQIVQKLKTMPIAIATDEANDQHYEVPAKFYDLCLGPRKKYSSGLWPKHNTTFEESEIAMLNKYCELAGTCIGYFLFFKLMYIYQLRER